MTGAKSRPGLSSMRIALGIEYDGSAYNGWQRQHVGSGVQELLETALGKIADQPISVVCAGRTDTGVHATGQVVHFDTPVERTIRGWIRGVNSNLPEDICVSWARVVDETFHARFSALARSYQYLIFNRDIRSALCYNRAWWVHRHLDQDRMQQAADLLKGRHDFSAFRAAGCQAHTPSREVTELRVTRVGRWLTIDITANAFLQHMVRNITGVLVAIGAGEEDTNWAKSVLEGRDRTKAGIAAPPQGLTLVNVVYPDNFGLLAEQFSAPPGIPDQAVN